MTPTDRLKVLHVDTGRTWRGGQGQVFNLCKGLREHDVPQALACPGASPLARRAADAGVRVCAFEGRSEWNWNAARRLHRIVSEQNVTIVHAHDAHAHALARAALRHNHAVRLIVSRRVDFSISRNPFSRRKYLDPRIRFLAISSGVRNVLVAGGVTPANIRIVPSGVDPDRFSYNVPRERMREELGIAPEAPVIGNIASLVDHKGHRYLLEATPTILRTHPDAQIVIVGDGPLSDALHRQAEELGIAGHVHFTGFRSDVETFLSGFDVFALSSHLEGLCTSLIDAMFHRVPVVATDTGGVPDLVRDGDTGLLVPPHSGKALAEGIRRVIEDAESARRMAGNAYKHVMKGFTAEAMVKNTIEAYSERS